MFKNKKNAKKEELTEKTAQPEIKSEVVKKAGRGFLGTIIRENIQDVLIGLLFVLGFKKSAQTKEGSGSGTVIAEKQTPNWILSIFPSWTDEDEVEYDLALTSHTEMKAKKSAEEFEENLKKEGVYDEVKYRVRVVKKHREFIEQVKHPAPKDDSGGRLNFQVITISSPVLEFMDRLLEEKTKGGTSEEIFERQKRIAINRKFIEKKHWLKKISENKTDAILTILAAILVLIAIIAAVFA